MTVTTPYKELHRPTRSEAEVELSRALQQLIDACMAFTRKPDADGSNPCFCPTPKEGRNLWKAICVAKMAATLNEKYPLP